MKVEMINIKKIKPYEKNPRLNKKAVDVVAMSIQEYGWQQPLVVDNDMTIVVGHTRYEGKDIMLSLTRRIGTGIKIHNDDTNEDIFVFFNNVYNSVEKGPVNSGRFYIDAPQHYKISRVDNHGNNETKKQ